MHPREGKMAVDLDRRLGGLAYLNHIAKDVRQ